MDVDKARGDDMASGVKGALGALPEIADGDNPAVTNSDIAAVRRKLHAVYDRAVLDKQIILSHEDHPFTPHLGEHFVRSRMFKSRTAVQRASEPEGWNTALESCSLLKRKLSYVFPC